MPEIVFLTLFLGLTLGPQPIELTVTGPAAAVEILLDGAVAARLDAPPWKTTVDFGPALLPHELVARAVDAQGRETGRARQWVNLPRPPAEVDLVVERGPDGRPSAVTFSWQSLTGEHPSAVAVTLDGRPLPIEPGNRVGLPKTDPAKVSVLSFELRFYGNLVARRDMAFGGGLGEEVSTELTAVVVRLREGKELPPPEKLGGWLLAGGEPLPVAAVEKGPAQLLIVRGALANRELVPGWDGRGSRQDFKLAEGDKIGFVWPQAKASPGGGAPTELFDGSRLYDAGGGGVLWHLRWVTQEGGTGPQRLTDAVAVAGLLTLYKSYRRAVLLILDGQDEDASRSDPALVRGYMKAVRVPLVVWATGSPKEAAARWGPVERIDRMRRIERAFRLMKEDLEAQRILWVPGRHLPQSLTLAPAAAGVLELVE